MTAEPELTYLYRLFDRQGVLLYVGITKDLSRRWKEHQRGKAWYSQHSRMTTDKYDTWDLAHEAEIAAIVTEYPVYNVADVPLERRLTKDLSRLLRMGAVPPDTQMTALLRDLACALNEHLSRMPDEPGEPEPEKPKRSRFFSRRDPEAVPRLAAAWLKARMRYYGNLVQVSRVRADAEADGVSDYVLQKARLQLGIKTGMWDLCQPHQLMLGVTGYGDHDQCVTGLPHAFWVMPDEWDRMQKSIARQTDSAGQSDSDDSFRDWERQLSNGDGDIALDDDDEFGPWLDPRHKRMFELLIERGTRGYQPDALLNALSAEGNGPHRGTLMKWLAEATKKGYVFRSGKERSRSVRYVWYLPEGAEFDIPGWR